MNLAVFKICFTLEEEMKAVKIKAFGGIDQLEVVNGVPDPDIHNDQVLVEVKSASINPIDYKIREGLRLQRFPVELPAIAGGDFSGIVKKTGSRVTSFKVGDQVYGQAPVYNRGSGAFAELVAANVTHTAIKPGSTTFNEAAALPLAGVSALQAIEDHLELKKGQKILIHGGAGGIGSIAIEIAKSIGAFIATTVSAKDKDFVKEIGASVIFDYHVQKFENELRDYDAVLDTVGGEIPDKSLQILRSGGAIVSLLTQANGQLAREKGIRAMMMMTNTTTLSLDRLREYVDSGKVRAHIDRVFPLDEIRAAFTLAETGHPRGKVVIAVS
jgi:NADPH:quinone reductase-like Zn-dependent oxidoreductase